jgi:hypothetical protein
MFWTVCPDNLGTVLGSGDIHENDLEVFQWTLAYRDRFEFFDKVRVLEL